MKLSLNWIKEYVPLPEDMDLNRLAYDLTMSTVEVEGVENLADRFENIDVGVINEILPHPNADKLRICMVDLGNGEVQQIVCGGSNLYVGEKVAVSRPGAMVRWHGEGEPVKIGITKLRGVQSYGMICASSEIGLFDLFPFTEEATIVDLSAFDAPAGTNLADALDLNDMILEIDNKSMTNRPDLWGHYGIARELAALYDLPLKKFDPFVPDETLDVLPIEVMDTERCPRYMGTKLENLYVKEAPFKMQTMLWRVGLRPINALVDITNYVMLATGQPTHAFDSDVIEDHIVVRRAHEGEKLLLLNDKELTLCEDDLVIADVKSPIGLAGVMGGENSEIVADTVDVVFESANFNGTSIRQTALALGMRTESSGKFEKNIDPMLTVPALNRACELVELLGAGEVMDGMIDILNYIPEPRDLELEPERINALLGTNISEADMVDYLRRLEVPVEGRTIHVPSWRPDLVQTADIAEEVGRLYGYNEIPTTSFRSETAEGGYTGTMVLENKTGALCRSLGFSEILTYSFVSPTIFDMIRLPQDSPLRKTLRIQNPLGEDASIMRTVALPSMLAILSRNYNCHNAGVKLYELAKVYLPREGQALPEEPKHLMLGVYGPGADFFTLKGEIEAIFRGMQVK
ncbi:MAG: phenylalanine--tRNA ligase subunit beta, partial [Firmicutes bacterium]|nr:phenylalanine--tRNA ligase subunit beta [Bacillota bacterium]